MRKSLEWQAGYDAGRDVGHKEGMNKSEQADAAMREYYARNLGVLDTTAPLAGWGDILKAARVAALAEAADLLEARSTTLRGGVASASMLGSPKASTLYLCAEEAAECRDAVLGLARAGSVR